MACAAPRFSRRMKLSALFNSLEWNLSTFGARLSLLKRPPTSRLRKLLRQIDHDAASNY